jgi:hypothetical protein
MQARAGAYNELGSPETAMFGRILPLIVQLVGNEKKGTIVEDLVSGWLLSRDCSKAMRDRYAVVAHLRIRGQLDASSRLWLD